MRGRWLILIVPCVWLPFAACGDDAAYSLGDGDAGGSDPEGGAIVPDGSAGSDSGVASDAGVDVDAAPPPLPARCNGSIASTIPPPSAIPPALPALTVTAGFKIEAIATVSLARELVALPNGDLLVGTLSSSAYIVPHAEDDTPGDPMQFTDSGDTASQGFTYSPYTCTIYLASEHDIFSFPYVDGLTTATISAPIALVRQGPAVSSPHFTTSLTFDGTTLFAGVGSSCDACVEIDPTRATVQRMDANGANMATRATRLRNPIALAVNPATGTTWAGGAGQDGLGPDHPYEYFDAVTLHAGVPDYGWPDCEEDQVAYTPGANCSQTVIPRIELPAHATLIGAVFYPKDQKGPYAFPAAYQGGVFITSHGSSSAVVGADFLPPRIVYVAMNGDTPVTPVNWNDPTAQWTEFVGGFQLADGVTRIARPTGIAVGPKGTLFSDDQANIVYRIRPM